MCYGVGLPYFNIGYSVLLCWSSIFQQRLQSVTVLVFYNLTKVQSVTVLVFHNLTKVQSVTVLVFYNLTKVPSVTVLVFHN